jgi:hypothetical protein
MKTPAAIGLDFKLDLCKICSDEGSWGSQSYGWLSSFLWALRTGRVPRSEPRVGEPDSASCVSSLG